MDINELERLARAANPTGTWGRMRACITLNGRIVFGCEPVSDQGGHTKAQKFAKFFSAANPSAVLEIIARLRSAEQDAARWRHARQHLAIEDIEEWSGWSGHTPDEEESRKADAAVDTARAKSKGEQP